MSSYLVRDRQGNVFGPADEMALRQWVSEGRIVAGMEITLQGPLATRRWELAEVHPTVADLLRGDGGESAAVMPATEVRQGAVSVSRGAENAGSSTEALGYATEGPRLNTLALLSVIFGGVGLAGGLCGVCCAPVGVVSVLLGIAGLVMGLIGWSQIRNNEVAFRGRPLAIIGVILGGVVVLLGIGAIVVAVIMYINNPP